MIQTTPTSSPQILDLPDSDLSYYPKLMDPRSADRLYASLLEEIEWKQNKISFYGKESLVPRLEAWHGDEGMSYAYSGIRMHPKPWTPTLLEIRKFIEPLARTRFNSVLLNNYRDGKDRVAWHSDDEKELGPEPVIGSVSLGARRRFKLRHREYPSRDLQSEIILEHGSFLLMKGPTQRFWKHEVPRTARPVGGRINLTFRVILEGDGEK